MKTEKINGPLWKAAFLILALLAGPRPEAGAAIPNLMAYHGILRDGAGNYLTGTYSMTFRIYDTAADGNVLWSETQPAVAVSSGRFNVQLGSVTSLALNFTSDYWLSVQVGADSEMTPRQRLTSVGYAYRAEEVVNGFTQGEHDALSHRNIEGVKANAANIAKTNFKLDAYTLASANSMGDMIVDTFNDAAGVDAAGSSGHQWRGSPNYDVKVLSDSNLDYPFSHHDWPYLWLNCNEGWTGGSSFDNKRLGQQFQAPGAGNVSRVKLAFYDSSSEYGASWEAPYQLWVQIWTLDANGFPASQVGGDSVKLGAELVNSQWGSGAPSILSFTWSANAPALQAAQNYALVVVTDYPHGNNHKAMRLASDSSGSFAAGKAIYLDNATNAWRVVSDAFDVTFEMSITSAAGSAMVRSVAFPEPNAPKEAMVIADETLNTGTITYSVSRDNGNTWTVCPKDSVVSISSQPSGTQVRWKAAITGDAELNAIAVAL